jgi:outer membrane immunogenic protein
MKRLFIASAVALALSASSAFAADLSVPYYKAPPPLPPPVSWTGCYVDGGIGYGMYTQTSHSEISATYVPIGAQVTNGGEGWLGRLGGGCDYQTPLLDHRVVVGAFADYDFMNLRGTFSDPSGPVTGSEKETGAWYAGGRLGYLVTPSLLTYVDGGYTQTRFSPINFLTPLAAPVATGLTLSGHTYNGWFIGGGTEYALNFLPIHGLFWRTEYRYADYQAADVPIVIAATGGPFGVSEHIQKDVQTITSGLVWRFNFGGAPGPQY